MGWLGSIVSKAGALGYRVAKQTVLYGFNFLSHSFRQVGILPEVARSWATHAPSLIIAKGVGHTLLFDLSPMVGLQYFDHLLQHALSQPIDDDSAQAQAIATALFLVHWSVNMYTTRQFAQLVSHLYVNVFRAPTAFVKEIKRPPVEEKSAVPAMSKLGKYLNSGADSTVTLANDVAIKLLGQVGYFTYLAKFLTIYSNGRSIIRVTTPDRPYNDKGIESEQALALGAVHELMNWALQYGLASTTGLPSPISLMVLRQMLLIVQMSVAAHLPVENVKQGAGTLGYYDLVDWYERFMAYQLGLQVQGAKSDLPDFLKEMMASPDKSEIDWEQIGHNVQSFLYHPVTRAVVVITLPSMFHSLYNLTHDAVVRPHWQEIESALDEWLESVIKKLSNPGVDIAKKVNGGVSLTTNWVFGIERETTEFLLKLAASDKLTIWLRNAQLKLKSLGVDIVVGPVKSDPAERAWKAATDSPAPAAPPRLSAEQLAAVEATIKQLTEGPVNPVNPVAGASEPEPESSSEKSMTLSDFGIS